MQLNHRVTRKMYFDWANVGSMWLSTLFVFRLDHKGGDIGAVADLQKMFQVKRVHDAKIEIGVYFCNASFTLTRV